MAKAQVRSLFKCTLSTGLNLLEFNNFHLIKQNLNKEIFVVCKGSLLKKINEKC